MPARIVPLELKRLRGNPGKRRLGSAPQPAVAAEPPAPPEFLSADAQAHWRRLAPEVHRLGLLTVLDHDAFGAFCSFRAHWIEAERALAAKGLLAKGSTGNVVASPLFKVAVQSAREMIRIGNEFGLTPCGRARIAAGGYQGPQPDDDKWSGLLA